MQPFKQEVQVDAAMKHAANTYSRLFNTAQNNLRMVCEEYKDTPMCKKVKRRSRPKQF